MHAHFSSWDIDTAPFDVLDGGDVYCPGCGDAFAAVCDYCPDDNCKLIRPQADDRPGSALAVRSELEACLAAELSEDELLTLTHAALPTVIRSQ